MNHKQGRAVSGFGERITRIFREIIRSTGQPEERIMGVAFVQSDLVIR